MCGAVRTPQRHGSSFLRIRQCTLGTQPLMQMHRDVLVTHAIHGGEGEGGEGGGGESGGKIVANQRKVEMG